MTTDRSRSGGMRWKREVSNGTYIEKKDREKRREEKRREERMVEKKERKSLYK